MFAHARPGTSDTSAIPHDQVNNPGTINAIINSRAAADLSRAKTSSSGARPQHALRRRQDDDEVLVRARPRRQVLAAIARDARRVHHILKGGEDSIGALEAIQRVYFNIGSCAEQCWVNHLTDLRQVDPAGSATSARRRSTSASAGATARTSARSRIGSPTSLAFLFSKETTRPTWPRRARERS